MSPSHRDAAHVKIDSAQSWTIILRIMGKVILLTGALGTGKSTLRRSLGPCIAGLQHSDHGELLLRRKKQQGTILSYSELRDQSSSVITSADVSDTDEWVIAETGRLRSTSDCHHRLPCTDAGRVWLSRHSVFGPAIGSHQIRRRSCAPMRPRRFDRASRD
jgi:hypothetical protein